jgi:predicted nucleic acid-binding protein
MIVISDTTPLRYLTLLGRIDLLHSLFGKIHCPDLVLR